MASLWEKLCISGTVVCAMLYLTYLSNMQRPVLVPMIWPAVSVDPCANSSAHNAPTSAPTSVHVHKPTNKHKPRATWDTCYLPCIARSHISLENRSTGDIMLGDFIIVKIKLYNCLNMTIKKGGEMVLIWMESQNGSEAVAGNVTDYGNGSYTGILRAMWTGNAVIRCAIACTNMGFQFMYYHFKLLGQGRQLMCSFEKEKQVDSTLGSPTPPVHGNYYNLTYFGSPWYCLVSTKPGFLPKHWTGGVGKQFPRNSDWDFATNPPMAKFFKRSIGHANFPKMDIIIKTGAAVQSLLPKNPCRGIPPFESWARDNPIGFYHNYKWYLPHCVFKQIDIHQCFQNKTVLMLGDSTVRNWFLHLTKNLNITVKTTDKRSKLSADKSSHNYTIRVIPHGLPMYYYVRRFLKYRPIHDLLNDIPRGSTDIVLIHLGAHFHYNDPSLFKARMMRTADSVRRLVKRAPNIKLVIKGSHYYTHRDVTLGGMWGPLYDQITRDIFKDLYNTVHFLDTWSLTVAIGNTDLHPVPEILENMLKIFIAYVCH